MSTRQTDEVSDVADDEDEADDDSKLSKQKKKKRRRRKGKGKGDTESTPGMLIEDEVISWVYISVIKIEGLGSEISFKSRKVG